jgi:hypothetical protein
MKKIWFMLMIAAIVLAACGAPATAPMPFAEAPAMQEGYAAPAQPAESAAYDVQKSVDYAATGNAAPGQERMVIENAEMILVVEAPQAKLDSISALAARLGGFVVSSNIYEAYSRNGVLAPEGSMVIRVPSEKLDEALQEIKADVVEVQSENRSGEDITQQYTDLASRLKNLEAAERQLTIIMEKAEKTEDVLAVFQQLTYYREQIEVVKGQMQYFEQAAALSAISIRLIAEVTVKPIEIGPWKPQGVAAEAIQDLIEFFKGFVEFIIRLVLFILPVLFLIFSPFYLAFLGIRAWWRRRKARRAAQAAPAEK